MPQVTENADGTRTLSLSSDELTTVRRLVDEHVPELKKVLEFADSREVRATIDFLRSALS